jgi:cathepsin O
VFVESNYTCNSFVNQEDKIVALLNTLGPLSVAVDGASWQDYLGGVIQYHCETNLNHAAVIVGYDRTTSPGYYIVRNSWGRSFGLDGYLHIAMGSNLCGNVYFAQMCFFFFGFLTFCSIDHRREDRNKLAS